MGNPEDETHVGMAIDELKNLVNTSYFGMTTKMPYFIMGDVLYPVKKYKDSAENSRMCLPMKFTRPPNLLLIKLLSEECSSPPIHLTAPPPTLQPHCHCQTVTLYI